MCSSRSGLRPPGSRGSPNPDDSGDGDDGRGTAEPKEGEPPRMVAIKKVFELATSRIRIPGASARRRRLASGRALQDGSSSEIQVVIEGGAPNETIQLELLALTAALQKQPAAQQGALHART